MTYRKFKADYLFLGDRIAGSDSVLITTAEGRVQAVVPEREAGEGVEQYPGLLSPGFVNCHCHLELSHLHGVIPEGTGLVDFLSMVIRQRDKEHEKLQKTIAAAEQQMLDNGIVAVGDICNTTDTLQLKRAGRLQYYNFIETMGFIDKSAPDRFAASLEIHQAFEKAVSGSILPPAPRSTVSPHAPCSIVPHAPYSVSSALFRLIASFADRRILTMHSQETAAENEFFLTGKGDFLRLYDALGLDVSWFHGTGKRSLESILPYFDAGQPMILVHNVATEAVDLEKAAAWPNLFFCLCPNANQYIGGAFPDVSLLMDRGCRIVVGTDSLASNHQLSILEELKPLQRAFPWLETATLLSWATSEGAAALQMDATLGSFTPGKTPGVLLLQGLAGSRLTQKTTVKRLV